MLHVLFNPGPLTLIVDALGHLVDAQTRFTGDVTDRTVARLLRRGALVDLGPVPEE